ncbi:MAG: D-alanyl-D-alanine carboxypeptidase [Nitrospirae bacterium]|nr:D-alanyl-D-alanine carboxypeptidase [Nitrospirota bacterium]
MKRLQVTKLTILLFLLFLGGLSGLQNAYADEVGARAAVVIDGATERILFAKNPQWKLPPASTTKLITAMVVLDKISPDTMITVSENAAGIPSVHPHLRAGERFSVRDILYLALMRSVNSAAVTLAEAVAGSEARFVELMNEKAAAIGADNTRFINASGLPGPGQHITAFDLAKVLKTALDYPLIRDAITTRTKGIYSEGGRSIFVKNTDQLLWVDEDLIGGKTGYTREARHCFVCAARKGGNTLITAVLGESVRDDLWHDSQILLARGYDVITQKAEPVIYFSSANESPIVYAAYKRTRAAGRHRVLRHGVRRGEVLTAHKDRVSPGEKSLKKKRGGHLKVAKKSKKTTGRNLS